MIEIVSSRTTLFVMMNLFVVIYTYCYISCSSIADNAVIRNAVPITVPNVRASSSLA